MYTSDKQTAWRRHQTLYLSTGRKKSVFRRWIRPFLILCFFMVTGFGAWAYLGQGYDLAGFFQKPKDLMIGSPDAQAPVQAPPEPEMLTRAQVRELLQEQTLINAGDNEFIVDSPGGPLRVVTFLDISLTRYLTATLDHLKTLTRAKPTQIAMVVMDAHEGHILAMAGFDLESDDTNPCTQAMYPAASIFKIVTAAAAVDALDYSPRTPLYFNGNKYTLYKRQLTEARNKHTVTVSLEKAFAESINPVFGKLGQLYLGRETLAAYAHAFGFNQTPDTDLIFDPGRFYIHDDEFHLAELGSGYNRDTLISPVFGAMMITPVLNRGQAVVPAVVSHVIDDQGHVVYRHDKQFFSTAVSPQATEALVDLMKRTVSQGTARKSFGPVSRDKVLSELEIGGKTGSLSNRTYTIKYDWFTGFARETQGTRAIVFSIVVGHGEYIGTRATAHARSIITRYFTQEPVGG